MTSRNKTHKLHFQVPPRWTYLPEYPGIYSGWEGSAWVYLQMGLKGMIEVSPSFLRRLDRALQNASKSYGKVSHSGAFIGPGGAYIVATMAGEFDSRFRAFQKPLLGIWKKKKTVHYDNDLNMGHAGTLICMAELIDLVPGWTPSYSFLEKCHNSVIETLEAIRKNKKADIFLGFAHGLAGTLLALEISRNRFSFRTPKKLLDWAFTQIDREQFPVSNASVWPVSVMSEEITNNAWCHGAPGIALGLLGCYRETGRKDYFDLFKKGARGAEQFFSLELPNICCGLGGAANLFIEAYRATRKESWLEKSRKLLPKKPSEGLSPKLYIKEDRNKLFRGIPGAAYTYDRLNDPDLALPGTGFAGNRKP